jgi:hypothetical protein
LIGSGGGAPAPRLLACRAGRCPVGGQETARTSSRTSRLSHRLALPPGIDAQGRRISSSASANASWARAVKRWTRPQRQHSNRSFTRAMVVLPWGNEAPGVPAIGSVGRLRKEARAVPHEDSVDCPPGRDGSRDASL